MWRPRASRQVSQEAPAGRPLAPEALVLRGGTLRVESLHKSVEVSVEKLKRPGLSVFAAEGVSRAELLEMSPQVRHPLLSFSTAERIYNAGFEMEQTFSLPHYTVWLPEDWEASSALRAFTAAFDPPLRRQQVTEPPPGSATGDG
jgi:hypothetical protein